MTVLDLLSALGGLPTSGEGGFRDAVQAITGREDTFSQRRFLEGLGHARTEQGDRKIHALAPRLVSLPRDERGVCVTVLAGARNADLVSELKYLSQIRGIHIESEELGSGFPERIALKGSAAALRDIAGHCNSLPLEIADDPTIPDAWRLLASSPSLQSIIRGFIEPEVGVGQGDPQMAAEVFNPLTGYYDRWSRLREGYLSYYVLWKKEAYDYRLFWWQSDEQEEAEGRWIQRLSPLGVESFWGRWAVAYSARGTNALPAVSGDGAYRVPRLTPLPMALHRVCCLCSGFPPEERDGFYIYRGVPAVIQSGVNDRLTVDDP